MPQILPILNNRMKGILFMLAASFLFAIMFGDVGGVSIGSALMVDFTLMDNFLTVGGGAAVGAFLGAGAENAAGDFAVESLAGGGLEGVFDAAVFAGVEGEDGEAAAGVEAPGQDAQEGVEGGKFFVHFDADGLEDTAH